MKLNQEGVEKATDALFNFRAERQLWGLEATEARARAALTAYFDHLREVGLMREGIATVDEKMSGRWNAISETQYVKDDTSFPALILRTEKE